MTARFAPNPQFRLAFGSAAAGGSSLGLSPVPLFPREPGRVEQGVYIPEGYEPNYAYPLIVWVQGPEGNAHELQHVLPLISERNYVGVAFRARTKATRDEIQRDGLPSRTLHRLLRELRRLVRATARDCHLHADRIYLAGFDVGGSIALQLGAASSARVAGIAVFGTPLPPLPVCRSGGLNGTRILLGAGIRDRRVSPADLQHAQRRLQQAGMDANVCQYDAGHQVTRAMLADVNRWIMEAVAAPQARL